MSKVILATRKVQQIKNQNDSSVFLISLPVDWIEKMKIKKSDTLVWELDTEDSDKLVLKLPTNWG